MSSINIEQPPEGTDPNLTAYLVRLQNKIGIALSQNNQLPKLFEVPKNPQNGKIYYFTMAVGPITTAGFWGYEEGSWVKL